MGQVKSRSLLTHFHNEPSPSSSDFSAITTCCIAKHRARQLSVGSCSDPSDDDCVTYFRPPICAGTRRGNLGSVSVTSQSNPETFSAENISETQSSFNVSTEYVQLELSRLEGPYSSKSELMSGMNPLHYIPADRVLQPETSSLFRKEHPQLLEPGFAVSLERTQVQKPSVPIDEPSDPPLDHHADDTTHSTAARLSQVLRPRSVALLSCQDYSQLVDPTYTGECERDKQVGELRELKHALQRTIASLSQSPGERSMYQQLLRHYDNAYWLFRNAQDTSLPRDAQELFERAGGMYLRMGQHLKDLMQWRGVGDGSSSGVTEEAAQEVLRDTELQQLRQQAERLEHEANELRYAGHGTFFQARGLEQLRCEAP